jgi:hypothetical protein
MFLYLSQSLRIFVFSAVVDEQEASATESTQEKEASSI